MLVITCAGTLPNYCTLRPSAIIPVLPSSVCENYYIFHGPSAPHLDFHFWKSFSTQQGGDQRMKQNSEIVLELHA